MLAARAYSALALLGVGGGCSADEEEGQEGNQEPCLRVWMHGKSLAHAAVMGYQGMRHFVARGEMIGVAVLVVIGVALLALAPAKQAPPRQVAG